MSALSLLRAQVEAEVKSRLRSSATLLAVLALFVASFLWIPDPATQACSIAWQTAEGTLTSSVYNSAYVGAASAILASLFLSLIGFYLVAGSVRRDRERGVGAILAATPLSNTAYLGGKVAAHAVYLLALAGAALAAGLLVFIRYGTGPLASGDFLGPYLLLAAPGLVFVAATAVFFDVAPGLRGPGGLVVFFFAWGFLFMLLPAQLHGGVERSERLSGIAAFDPVGVVTFMQALEESLPEVAPGKLSVGIQWYDEPIARVAWSGVSLSPAVTAARLAQFGWTLLPLGAAILAFDRFDPARARRSLRRARRWERAAGAGWEPERAAGGPTPRRRGSGTQPAPATAPPFAFAAGLPGVGVAPGGWRSVLAEARLVWVMAGPLRWLLPSAGLVAAVPGAVGMVGTGLLLLLLAPAVSETAARERLYGTGSLVLCQPGVPLSPVLWKAAAVGLFVAALGLPRLAVAALTAPERALAFLLGLAFLAAFAAGAGALTGGGKLFTGVYVAAWYVAVNGAPGLDFSGAFAREARPATALAFAAGGAALLAFAWAVERRRGRVALS